MWVKKIYKKISIHLAFAPIHKSFILSGDIHTKRVRLKEEWFFLFNNNTWNMNVCCDLRRQKRIFAHKIILLGSSSKLASTFNGVVANDVKRKICLRMWNKNFFSHSPLTNFWADFFLLFKKIFFEVAKIWKICSQFIMIISLGKVCNHKLWNYLFYVSSDHHHRLSNESR